MRKIRLVFVCDIMLSNISSNSNSEIFIDAYTPGKLFKYHNYSFIGGKNIKELHAIMIN